MPVLTMRREYLTGFHKRKLERQKKAQLFHKEQDRLAKIEERKQVKLEREKDMLEQMDKYKEQLRILHGGDDSDDEGKTTIKLTEEYEEWEGFGDGDDEDENDEDKPKSILKKRELYGDDGTEVVIEDMNEDIEEIAKLNFVNLEESKKVLEESIDRAKKYAVIAGAEKPKQKKKKFRYLSKTERRDNQRKSITNKRRK